MAVSISYRFVFTAHRSGGFPMRHGALMLLLLSLLIISATPASGQGTSDKLRVGDAAPGLSVERWLSGEETYIENGNVYLVFFVSKESIEAAQNQSEPRNLNSVVAKVLVSKLYELYQKYSHRGLHVIIMTDDEELRGIQEKKFGLKQQVDVPVALDRRDTTHDAWVEASDNESPISFLIDEMGKIQYMGLMQERNFETIVRLVLDGRYDYQKMRNAAPRREAAEKYRELRNFRMYHQVMQEMIDLDTRVFAYDNLDRFKTMLVDQDEPTNAYAFARTLLADYAQDGPMLANLAETIATDPYIPAEKRDLDFALEVAQTAQNAPEFSEPDKYAIEALVRFHRGELQQAVSLQKRAFFTAVPIEKERYRHVLRDYQEAAQNERRRERSESANP
jgi:hypothetical protein